MEKVKASEGKMKKYRDLYKVEKQRYKEALQRHQEDHMDEVEIINLHKRCTKADRKTAAKTGTKADRKTATKTDPKAASKAPRSGYHLFLREQLDEMTGEDRKNYSSIVSRRWKDINEDPARLSAYSDSARQMRNNNPLVQHEKTVMERTAVKRIQRNPKKAPKISKLIESNDSDYEESDVPDHDKSMVKRIQKMAKIATPGKKPVVKQPLELIETDPRDSYLEITLRDTAFDSIVVSVEGTYRGKKILCVGTCVDGDLTKMMVSLKVDE